MFSPGKPVSTVSIPEVILVSGTAAKVNGIIWGFLSFEGS
jgi:hypothetical protein